MSRDELDAVLAGLPDASGGAALVVSTGGEPPALALLSTGDVLLEGDRLAVAVLASSSVAQRLGGSFTLLVPVGDGAMRIEAVDASVETVGSLARLDGTVRSLRQTSEPPWRLDMAFRPLTAGDPAAARFVEYWTAVKSWLKGDLADPPAFPS